MYRSPHVANTGPIAIDLTNEYKPTSGGEREEDESGGRVAGIAEAGKLFRHSQSYISGPQRSGTGWQALELRSVRFGGRLLPQLDIGGLFAPKPCA